MTIHAGEFLPVFSIGHSQHPKHVFLELLRQNKIEVVLDVRSSPYSRRAPQFNRPDIKSWLTEAGIRYTFGGNILGGRPRDPALYVGGQVKYELMAMSESFRSGLRRIARAAKTSRLALMCAEAEPIECHRFLLIAREISHVLDVFHILPSGRAEAQKETEQRLLAAAGFAQSALFDTNADALGAAYTTQSARVAFAPQPWSVAANSDRLG